MKNVNYINAGAGSGKTWTLSHRLSDALLGADGNKQVNPSQVILTTFTRAAASEFREKARAVLLEAGKPEMAAALEGAAIGTVHSVCEQFVKKYWYKLGLSPVMGVLQEEDKNIYVDQSVAEILKGREADIAFFNDFRRDFDIVKSEDFITIPNPDWWKESLKRIISMMSYYGINDLSESADRSCAEVDSLFDGPELDTTEMEHFLEKYKTYIAGVNSDIARKAEKSVKTIQESLHTLPSLISLLEIVSLNKFVGGAKKGAAAFLKMYPDVDFDVLTHDVQSQLVSRGFGSRIKEVIRKLFELAKEWQSTYKEFKESHHVLDFDDLEQYFLKMLRKDGFEDVRNEIKETYKLLMVDEFQDSNPVQIAIFDVLSDLIADGGGSTTCVGDPKQSIYAFRGSDMELVKTETAKFLRDKTLEKSFRSRPRLVDLSNKVFNEAFRDVLDQKDIELPEKDRDATELAGREPILHWDASDGSRDLAAKISEILYKKPWKVCKKKEKGEKLPQEIPISPKHIAVLCRNGYEVKEIVSALRDAGIPVTSSNMDMINWAECQLLLSLLRWINDPSDDGAKADIWHLMEDIPTEKILLARQEYLTPNGGSRDKWLSDKECFVKLDSIRKRVRTLPISVIISTLVLELDLMRLCQKWGHPVARCKNLGLMQKIAAQYEDHCIQMNLASSIPGFINYVHTMPDDLKNEDTSSDTVKVITYHKSKGLEWPVVILGSLERKVDDDGRIAVKNYMGVTNCKNPEGDNYIFFLPDLHGAAKTLPEPIQNKVLGSALYKDIKRRYLLEETRLLYVGLTRARDYVVTLSNEGKKLNWIMDCGCGNGEVTERNGKTNPWGQVGFEADYCRISDLSVTASPARQAASAPSLTPVVRHDQKYVSPSKIDSTVPVKLKEVFKDSEMKHNIDEGHSAVCGTCIHNFFAAYSPIADDPQNTAVAKRLIEGSGLTAQLPSPESLVSSAKQFFSWLAKTYPGDGEPMKELPFLFKSNGAAALAKLLASGQTARGEMDLVWVTNREKKRCILVDYKSYHGNPDLDSANEEVRKHYQGYAPQLLAYKSALEAAHWTVEYVFVYYFVQGRVVKFIF